MFTSVILSLFMLFASVFESGIFDAAVDSHALPFIMDFGDALEMDFGDTLEICHGCFEMDFGDALEMDFGDLCLGFAESSSWGAMAEMQGTPKTKKRTRDLCITTPEKKSCRHTTPAERSSRKKMIPYAVPALLMTAAAFVALLSDLSQGSRVVIEGFAGCGAWVKACASHGCKGIGLDSHVVLDQSDFVYHVDLTCIFVLEQLLKFISRGFCRALGFGLPCCTLSMARRGKPRQPGKKGGFPVRLRSRESPWGLANLLPHDALALSKGNDCIHAFLKLMEAGLAVGIKIWLENPLRSYLWYISELLHFLEKALHAYFSPCSFGTSWRKDTRLAFWNCTPDEIVAFTSRPMCKSKKKLCCYTGVAHEAISPSSMSKNMFRDGFATAKAGAYPGDMAESLAQLVL